MILGFTYLEKNLCKRGPKQGFDTLLSHAVKITWLNSTSTCLKLKETGGYSTPQGNLSLKLKIHEEPYLTLPHSPCTAVVSRPRRGSAQELITLPSQVIVWPMVRS